jgi:hypothetical protein
MRDSNRKTRSDKFPLTLHPTGQYCKKIRGHIYYFGSDRKQALENYLDQAIFLHGYNNAEQKSVNGNMTLREICDMYLKYQNTKLTTHLLYSAREKRIRLHWAVVRCSLVAFLEAAARQ